MSRTGIEGVFAILGFRKGKLFFYARHSLLLQHTTKSKNSRIYTQFRKIIHTSVVWDKRAGTRYRCQRRHTR
jgi:hypothetical protein